MTQTLASGTGPDPVITGGQSKSVISLAAWVERHTPTCLCLMLLLLLVVVFGNRQTMTGDEPRYLLYAMSFIRHGSFVMPLEEWNRVSMRAAHYASMSLPAGGGNVVVMNGVYLPVLLSPIAGLFSLAGLRGTTLLAGLAGLWFLHRLARRVAGPVSALVALFIVAFSMPLLPYIHIFYMETFLFALVCCGWERLQRDGRGLGGDLLTASMLVLIPMVHMRGSMVAAVLFLFLLQQLVRRRLWGRVVVVLLIALGIGAAFVGLNLGIYGAITGPVNTARPPSPGEWFAVLSMQLFNVHHGLLAYAPIWIVGYAGLLAGLRWRPTDSATRILRQGLLLGLIAAVTGVGVNPGECWPARFWVLSMPMLTIGLAYWLHRVRGVLPIACLVGLVAITAVNSRMFASHPNQFLEDRQTSTTYDALFDRWGHVDPNLILPVETGMPADVAAARTLTLAATGMVLLLTLSLRNRWAGFPALLILLGTVDTARAHRVEPGDYTVTALPASLFIALHDPLRQPAILFGRGFETWFVPPELERFTVRSTGPKGGVEMVQAANQVVVSGCTGPTTGMTVLGQGINLDIEAKARLAIVESGSLLRRLRSAPPC